MANSFSALSVTHCVTMVSTHKKARKATVVAHDEEERGFPWLEGALVVSTVALFFQLFPGTGASVVSFLALVLSYFDVRGWTWRSYAVVCAIAITALVILKGRQNNA
jgi:hypothetical protein